MVRYQKRQLKGLLLVESRVTETSVVCRQIILIQTLTTTHTLCDSIASELECLLKLTVDVAETTCLDASGCGQGVAVHGVALPDNASAVLRVLDRTDEGEKVGGWCRGTNLDTNGVGDATEELNVSMVDLTGTVADPDEVRRGIVVLLLFTAVTRRRGACGSGSGLLQKTGQRLFIVKEKTLMTAQRLLDTRGDGRVLLLEFRIPHMAKTPVKRPVKISNARGESGADVVECGSRMVIGLDETVRINRPVLETVAVNDVSLEAGDFLSIDHLGGTRSRLRILPSHTANAHNSLVGSPDEHNTHLQQELDLALNGALATVVEEFRTITTLEEKGIALCHIAKMGLESDDLIGVHQRRQVGEFLDGFVEGLLFGIVRRLLNGL
ncbi:hypothetical protein HG530_011213 [Fusarium avenaceum]|nr:hypothetical protein HG530_011213 [Fusarium avenaceum]